MSHIKLFESKQIRSVWNETDKKWYFSVQDVVLILSDSADIKQYVKRMLSRDEQLKSNWGTICALVEMEAGDGKRRKIQASDTKGLLRIIQSIPSQKAEPFKLWLAQVGSDRLDEIENPELAAQQAKKLRVIFFRYFNYFFLDEKVTKNQGETPTPILFSRKSAQCHRKNCSSHRFAKSAAPLPMYA